MMKMNLLRGLAAAVDVYLEPSRYNRPSGGAFRQDSARLAGDVRRIGADMKSAIAKHGKQPHDGKGRK